METFYSFCKYFKLSNAANNINCFQCLNRSKILNFKDDDHDSFGKNSAPSEKQFLTESGSDDCALETRDTMESSQLASLQYESLNGYAGNGSQLMIGEYYETLPNGHLSPSDDSALGHSSSEHSSQPSQSPSQGNNACFVPVHINCALPPPAFVPSGPSEQMTANYSGEHPCYSVSGCNGSDMNGRQYGSRVPMGLLLPQNFSTHLPQPTQPCMLSVNRQNTPSPCNYSPASSQSCGADSHEDTSSFQGCDGENTPTQQPPHEDGPHYVDVFIEAGQSFPVSSENEMQVIHGKSKSLLLLSPNPRFANTSHNTNQLHCS